MTIDKPDLMTDNEKTAIPAEVLSASAPPSESVAHSTVSPSPGSDASTEAPKTVFAGAKRKVGRPPGPSKRTTEFSPTATKPPEAFTGGPPKEEPRTLAPNSAVSPGVASAIQDVMASPEALADIGQVALDGAVHAVAVWRYGKAEAESFKATQDARKEIRRAMLVFIQASAVKMTPGQALIVAIVAAYGPVTFEKEMARRGTKA